MFSLYVNLDRLIIFNRTEPLTLAQVLNFFFRQLREIENKWSWFYLILLASCDKLHLNGKTCFEKLFEL